MSADVANIDDYRPSAHLVIDCTTLSETVHVIPVALALKWASGELEPPPDIRQRIITEWLKGLAPSEGKP